MPDYYAILLRAVAAPGAGDAQWRRSIYARARKMLSAQLRSRRPPAEMADVAAEQAALEAAIERVESEMSWTESAAAATAPDGEIGEPDRDSAGDIAIEPRPDRVAIEPRPDRVGSRFGSKSVTWMVLAIVGAVLIAGSYAFWGGRPRQSASAPNKGEAASTPAQPLRTVYPAKDGDLAPGIDGGSSDVDLPYVFRRQPTFYRTLQPVGTIIVDKLQHFLYLIQPNNVALRYGIGLGDECVDLVGLHHVSAKSEWPQWQPPQDMIARKFAPAGPMPGGPGNPLGARVLTLDDGKSRIHGTNAPKTIGNSVRFGCIRLINDDIVDLYNRVPAGTAVIAGD